MTDPRLWSGMTRREILDQVAAQGRELRDLLEQAARLTPDPQDRQLYLRLALRQDESLRELVREEDRLEAVDFVQKAMDC